MLKSLFTLSAFALLSGSVSAVLPGTPTDQVVIDTSKSLTAKQAFDIFLGGILLPDGTIPYVGTPYFLADDGVTQQETCNGVDTSSTIHTFSNGNADFGFNTGLLFTGDCDLVATIRLLEEIKAEGQFYFFTAQATPVTTPDTYDIQVNNAIQSSFTTADLPDSQQPSAPLPATAGSSGTTPVALTIPAGTTQIRIRLNSHWFNQQDLGNDDPANNKYSEVALTPLRVTDGRVLGDPQFTGFLNQQYQIHGSDNTVYNVISSENFQYNALFKFLSEGKCRTGTACFSHPGNYFGEVGMIVKDSETGKKTEIRVIAGDVETGLSVEVDGVKKAVGDKITVGIYTITVLSAFEVSVESSEFNLVLQNSDKFLNQMASIGKGLMSKIAQYKLAKKTSASVESMKMPHGLLGQTFEKVEYDNRWKYIQGDLFDYIQSEGIFGTTNKFNRF